jgi:hypothetical protein
MRRPRFGLSIPLTSSFIDSSLPRRATRSLPLPARLSPPPASRRYLFPSTVLSSLPRACLDPASTLPQPCLNPASAPSPPRLALAFQLFSYQAIGHDPGAAAPVPPRTYDVIGYRVSAPIGRPWPRGRARAHLRLICYVKTSIASILPPPPMPWSLQSLPAAPPAGPPPPATPELRRATSDQGGSERERERERESGRAGGREGEGASRCTLLFFIGALRRAPAPVRSGGNNALTKKWPPDVDLVSEERPRLFPARFFYFASSPPTAWPPRSSSSLVLLARRRRPPPPPPPPPTATPATTMSHRQRRR